MSQTIGCKRCIWIGVLLSAALHAVMAAVLLHRGPLPATAPQDQVVALDLTMFQDGIGAGSQHSADDTAPSDPLGEPPEATTPPASKPEPLSETEPESIPATRPAEPAPSNEPTQSAPPPTTALASRPATKPKSQPHHRKQHKPHTKRVARATKKPRHASRAKRASMPTPRARASTPQRPRNLPKEPPASNRAGANASSVSTSQGARGQAGGTSGAAKAASERDYLNALRRAIARHQHYPVAARGAEETGTATIAFVIHANGRITQIRLASGSGHHSLDQAALKALYRLGRFKPIPKSIGRQSWSLRVPIRFDLR